MVSHITMSLVVVFIAVFMLFYVFDSIDKIVKSCEAGSEAKICKEVGPGKFGVLVLLVLLIVGGLTLIVCVTAYILMTA